MYPYTLFVLELRKSLGGGGVSFNFMVVKESRGTLLALYYYCPIGAKSIGVHSLLSIIIFQGGTMSVGIHSYGPLYLTTQAILSVGVHSLLPVIVSKTALYLLPQFCYWSLNSPLGHKLCCSGT